MRSSEVHLAHLLHSSNSDGSEMKTSPASEHVEALAQIKLPRLPPETSLATKRSNERNLVIEIRSVIVAHERPKWKLACAGFSMVE